MLGELSERVSRRGAFCATEERHGELCSVRWFKLGQVKVPEKSTESYEEEKPRMF
jgi:hypothetical protein